MNMIKQISSMVVVALLFALPLSTAAQWDKKPYTEWTEIEAQKVLNDSPWGRTQVFTSPMTLFREPTTGRQGSRAPDATNNSDATHVNFRIRFLSAKPIRQAVARMLEIKQKKPLDEDMAEHLKSLASGDFQEYIVITVSCDAREAGANIQEAYSLLNSRGTAELKNNTFLEIKGGKRLFLKEYQPPRRDGLGARFLFPRTVDGNPFITPLSDQVRFYTELSDTYRLDRRFKVRDMEFDGKLEY